MKPNTLICQVTDMDRSVAFYRQALGLEPSLVSPGWSQFEVGGLTIGLHPVFQVGGAVGKGGWVPGFSTHDLKQLRQDLGEIGSTVGDYHQVPGGTVIEFEDPDGNPLQAIQFGVSPQDLV